MKLVIGGTATVDPFGIPWLKHSFPVHEALDLSAAEAGKQFSALSGMATLGVSIEDIDGVLYADAKVAFAGIPLLERKLPLLEHLANGPQTVSTHGQIAFSGTVQIIE